MSDKTLKGAIAGAFAGLVGVTQVAAQDDGIAAAGNGGTADASANGGAVAVGDVNSGGNLGHAIGVGDTWGSVAIDGGSADDDDSDDDDGGGISNSTSLNITADGGTAIADASGGDYNIALEGDFDDDDGFFS